MRAWRPVPVEPSALGPAAAASAPVVLQAVLSPAPDRERAVAHRVRRRLERAIAREGLDAYVVSLSYRTVTYKALVRAGQLDRFYPDLRDERCRGWFAIFHQRYSTNTSPGWERAQPFRMLCHNGEINTLAGNAARMRAREGGFGSGDPELEELLRPSIDERGSDSSMLDESGRPPHEPRPGGRGAAGAAARDRDDRPARVGARPGGSTTTRARSSGGTRRAWSPGTARRPSCSPTDTSSARPSTATACARSGTPPPATVSSSARPRPASSTSTARGSGSAGWARARCSSSTRSNGGLILDPVAELAGARPFARWVAIERTRSPAYEDPSPQVDLARSQVAHGLTREDVTLAIRAMASGGHEPTSSMGDDTPMPPLAAHPRPATAFLRQRFAQVTNPALDHLRERWVMSLRTLLGPRPPLLADGPADRPMAELDTFLLERAPGGDAARRQRGTRPTDRRGSSGRSAARGGGRARGRIGRWRARGVARRDRPGTCPRSRRARRRRGAHRARRARPSPRDLDRRRDRRRVRFARRRVPPDVRRRRGRPGLALATVTALHDEGRLPGSGSARGGAGALPRRARRRRPQVDVAPRDLGPGLVPGRAGGRRPGARRGGRRALLPRGRVGARRARLRRARRAGPRAPRGRLRRAAGRDRQPRGGEVPQGRRVPRDEPRRRARPAPDGGSGARAAALDRGRRGCSRRSRGRERGAHLLRRATAGARSARRSRASSSSSSGARRPRRAICCGSRAPGDPVALAAVEPAAAIVARFSTAAISLGAISPEAHAAVAAGANRVGARSNSGEGGEDPARFGTERSSRIKQVASARFGVTPAYLVSADELQIKIAQGSKPGEGGQLPGREGHGRDRRAPSRAAGHRPHQPGPAPRHLLDRGPRAARLRPPAGEPDGGRVREARRRGGRRHGRRRRDQGARRRRPRRRRRRRAGRPSPRSGTRGSPGSSGSPRRAGASWRTAPRPRAPARRRRASGSGATSWSRRCWGPTSSRSARRCSSRRGA